jgi:hypothetical protein
VKEEIRGTGQKMYIFKKAKRGERRGRGGEYGFRP